MKHTLTVIIFWFIFLGSITSLSWGSQVVTEDVRMWAKKVLAEEKALGVLTEKNTLAVLYFRNKTGQADLNPLQKGFAVMLTTDLSSVKGIQVVERIKLQALTEEMGLGVSGLVEPDTAPRVGRLLGARWLVGGDITASLKVQANLLDVPSSEIIGQPDVEGTLSDLLRIEKEILFKIIELLKIEITPEQRAILRKPCSTRSSALIAFFKGIDASDRGDYEKAAEFYESALMDDPDICEVRNTLRELQVLGLVNLRKRSGNLLKSLKQQTSLTDQLTADELNKRKGEPHDTPTPVKIDIQFQ
jgi:TolB-like protein